MDPKIFDRILKSIDKLDTGSRAEFSDKRYNPVEISEDNFTGLSIPDSSSRIAFVDGGNAEIFSAPNISLQALRVAVSVYRGTRREISKRKEIICLVSAQGDEKGITFKAEFFSEKEKIEPITFDPYDKTMTEGNNRAEISKAAGIARRFLEIALGAETASELDEGDIVVLDGSLQCNYTGEKEKMENLYEQAAAGKVMVCGLSKTSRLMTDKGFPFSSALAKIAPKGAWIYSPVAEFEDEKRKADIFFAKLHPSSKYVFMLEFHETPVKEAKEAAGKIAANSTDPVFFGYPYGLIEADRLARVENTEKDYLRSKFMARAGSRWKELEELSHALDAHGVLDSIR